MPSSDENAKCAATPKATQIEAPQPKTNSFAIRRRNLLSLAMVAEYCPKWSPMHALREYFQNLSDAVITHAKEAYNADKNKIWLKVDPEAAATHAVNGFHNYIWTVEDEQGEEHEVGRLWYDEANQEIHFQNKGVIPNSALLLGAGKNRKDPDPLIAGAHGEGLKVAVLVLLRNGKITSIATGLKRWNFCFEEIPALDNEKALHVCVQNVDKEKVGDPELTDVCVSNITKEEYNALIDRHLPLREAVDAHDAKHDHPGVDRVQKVEVHLPKLEKDGKVNTDAPKESAFVLLDPYQKGRLYDRGGNLIQICNTEGDTLHYGYMANFDLDRDRLAIQDPTMRHRMTSMTLAIVGERQEAVGDLQARCPDAAHVTRSIFERLWNNGHETYFLRDYIPRKGKLAEKLFHLFQVKSRTAITACKVDHYSLPLHAEHVFYPFEAGAAARLRASAKVLGVEQYYLPMDCSWQIYGTLPHAPQHKSLDQFYQDHTARYENNTHALNEDEAATMEIVIALCNRVTHAAAPITIDKTVCLNAPYDVKFNKGGKSYFSKEMLSDELVSKNDPDIPLARPSIIKIAERILSDQKIDRTLRNALAVACAEYM